MNLKIKFILGIYLILSTIIVYSFDIKIRMLPMCAGVGFYSYWNNENQRCECYRGYILENRVCVKKSLN